MGVRYRDTRPVSDCNTLNTQSKVEMCTENDCIVLLNEYLGVLLIVVLDEFKRLENVLYRKLENDFYYGIFLAKLRKTKQRTPTLIQC